MKYELLVRKVDKSDHPMASKQGDVIVAFPAGHAWSEAERTNPEWRIVSVDLLPVELEALLSPPNPGEKPAKKRIRINLDRLSSDAPARKHFVQCVG